MKCERMRASTVYPVGFGIGVVSERIHLVTVLFMIVSCNILFMIDVILIDVILIGVRLNLLLCRSYLRYDAVHGGEAHILRVGVIARQQDTREHGEQKHEQRPRRARRRARLIRRAALL